VPGGAGNGWMEWWRSPERVEFRPLRRDGLCAVEF